MTCILSANRIPQVCVALAAALMLAIDVRQDSALAQNAEAPTAQYGDRDAMEHALQTEQQYDLYGVQFESGKATMQPDTEPLLDDIAATLTNFPGWRLRIVGHTDATGDIGRNRTLSLQRASAVRAALVDRGIDAGRLETAGAGENQPIADNATPEGRALNRRVELVRLEEAVKEVNVAVATVQTAAPAAPSPVTAEPVEAPAVPTDATGAPAEQPAATTSPAAAMPRAQAPANATTQTQAAVQSPAKATQIPDTGALPGAALAVGGESPAAAPAQEGPANLCQELLAFVKAPPPEAPPVAAPAAQGTAPATQQAPTGGAVLKQSAAQGGSAQQTAGQSGPAIEAPKPNVAPAAQASGQNAPQTSGIAAPVPPAPTSTPKESVLSLAEAEGLANANNMEACREAGRRLRLAGVAVPPPLLALTALDLRFHQQAQQAQQAQSTPQEQQPAPPQ
jgi:outer membrane protein OmpA-like peptidoglycan-associated protein